MGTGTENDMKANNSLDRSIDRQISRLSNMAIELSCATDDTNNIEGLYLVNQKIESLKKQILKLRSNIKKL